MIAEYFGFSKVGYLQEMANKYGDFKVAKGWKADDGEIKWTKHRSVMECWQSTEGLIWLEGVNNRSGLPSEVRIDIDAGDRTPDAVRTQFDRSCDALEKFHIPYLGFTSGSRGYHIHFMMDDTGISHDKERVRKAKERLIAYLGGELLKVNLSPMLTLEFAPNNKTGKPKMPIRGDGVWLDVEK